MDFHIGLQRGKVLVYCCGKAGFHVNLCDEKTIRELLGRHGFHFSKSMGQNFLIDPQIPADIAAASGADETCGVLEIGPGIGPLTAELAQRAGKVAAVELDLSLLPVLSETMVSLSQCGDCAGRRDETGPDCPGGGKISEPYSPRLRQSPLQHHNAGADPTY